MTMWRRLARTAAVAALALLANGCLYTNIQFPLDEDFDHTRLGDKIGRAHTHVALGLVAWGDAGTAAAAKDGQIQTVLHGDRRIFSVLFGVYTRISTVLYGE